MTADRLSYGKSLRKWSPALFLLGGGLVVGHATLRGIQAFTDLPTPIDAFGPTGYLLALLGLYGMYPDLVDRSPKLARAGALVAAVPVLNWIVILALGFGDIAGVLPSLIDSLPDTFYLAHLGTMILTYGLFGMATLRADVHPRTVGFLLMGPPILFIVLLTSAATVRNPPVAAFLVGSGQALVHLAIGYSLRKERALTALETPTSDGIVG